MAYSSGYAELLTSPAGQVLRQSYSSFLTSAIERSATWGVPDTSYATLKDSSIYELVRRDAVVFACMEARKHAVAATVWNFVGARESPIDSRAASVMEEIFHEIDDFDTARLKLAEADFSGSAYAKIMGRRLWRSFGGARPMMWWVPTSLIDVDRRRVQLTLDKKDKQNPKWGIKIANPFDGGKWDVIPEEKRIWLVEHVYDDVEISLGYGRGLIDSLYHYVFAKAKIFVEAVQAVERWGQGRTILYIDPNRAGGPSVDNQTLLNDSVALFNKTMARHTGALLLGDKAEMLNGPGEGWQLIDKMLTRIDGGIARAVLGSVMPSGGDSGDSGGSYARAKVEQDSSETLLAFSQHSLCATINRSISDLTWRLNRANFLALGLGTAAKPKFTLSASVRPDPDGTAERVVKLLSAGVPLKRSEVYEGTGFSEPGPTDDVIAPPPPPAEPPGAEPGAEGVPPGAEGAAEEAPPASEAPGASTVPGASSVTPLEKLKALLKPPNPGIAALKQTMEAVFNEANPFAKYQAPGFKRAFNESSRSRATDGRFGKVAGEHGKVALPPPKLGAAPPTPKTGKLATPDTGGKGFELRRTPQTPFSNWFGKHAQIFHQFESLKEPFDNYVKEPSDANWHAMKNAMSKSAMWNQIAGADPRIKAIQKALHNLTAIPSPPVPPTRRENADRVMKMLDSPEYAGWNNDSIYNEPAYTTEMLGKAQKLMTTLTGKPVLFTPGLYSQAVEHRLVKHSILAASRVAYAGFEVGGGFMQMDLTHERTKSIDRDDRVAANCVLLAGTIGLSSSTIWSPTSFANSTIDSDNVECGKDRPYAQSLIGHEMGHAMHFKWGAGPTWIHGDIRDYPGEKKKGSDDKHYIGFPPTAVGILKDISTKDLTEYARTDPFELVAETFSRIVHGRPVHPTVMSFYKHYKGPMPLPYVSDPN